MMVVDRMGWSRGRDVGRQDVQLVLEFCLLKSWLACEIDMTLSAIRIDEGRILDNSGLTILLVFGDVK